MASLLPPWPLPPAIILLVGAPFVAVLRGWPRKVVQLLVPALALAEVLGLAYRPMHPVDFQWMGYQAELLHVDLLRLVFGLVFATVTLVISLYALHVEDPIENVAGFVYAAGSLGVCFAGDLLSFVLFWELMGIPSALLIFQRRRKRSRAAATRYVVVHALGGTLLVAGMVTWVAAGHGIELSAIPTSAGVAGWLMLIGIAVNAAIPPLSAWLSDAYPEATTTGAVYLSVFTTKTAVFALVLLFPGWRVLLWAGVVMALYGMVYALVENDIRRLLAYSIISQVGYMVAAVGVGTSLALDGATAHAFAHVLYKSLLFMGAGAVITATGRRKLTDLGGLARSMPVVLGVFVVGAISIAGVPGGSGFVTKTMEIDAASSAGFPMAALLLELAAAGTFLYAGLKLVYFTFFGKPEKPYERIEKIPVNMTLAMVAGAALCIGVGVDPERLYAWLPYAMRFEPFTAAHLAGAFALLGGATVAFAIAWPWLRGRRTVTLDTDWLYRRPLPWLVLAISRGLVATQDAIGTAFGAATAHGMRFLHNPLVVAEQLIGRGVFEPRHLPEIEPGQEVHRYSEHRYRLPVGITVLVVVSVFALVALYHLVVYRGG